MRALASPYRSMEPCQSRWSSLTFKSTDTRGRSESEKRSWNDDASTANASRPSRAAREIGGPMLPTPRCPGPRCACTRRRSGRRRLAVGPGDGDVGCRAQPRTELQLAPDREPARALAHRRMSASSGTPGLVTTRGRSGPGALLRWPPGPMTGTPERGSEPAVPCAWPTAWSPRLAPTSMRTWPLPVRRRPLHPTTEAAHDAGAAHRSTSERFDGSPSPRTSRAPMLTPTSAMIQKRTITVNSGQPTTSK